MRRVLAVLALTCLSQITLAQVIILQGHDRAVTSGVFNMRGTTVATLAGFDVRFWRAADGALLKSRTIGASQVCCLSSNPGRPEFALSAGAVEQFVLTWDSVGMNPQSTAGDYRNSGFGITYSPDGAYIELEGDIDFGPDIYDTDSLYLVNFPFGSTNVFSHHSRRLAWTQWFEDTTFVTDIPSKRVIDTIPGIQPTFSADDTRLIVIHGWRVPGTRRPTIFDIESGKLLDSLGGPADALVRSATFGPHDSLITTLNADSTVTVWDAVTAQPLRVLRVQGTGIAAAVFSSDEARVMTLHTDGAVRLWNPRSGGLVGLMSGITGIGATFSPDGTRLLTVHADSVARVWDAQSGDLLHTLAGHTGHITSASWNADGTWIVTTSADSTGRLWGPEYTERKTSVDASVPSAAAFVLFPNPIDRTGDLRWRLSGAKAIATLTLTDMLGRVVAAAPVERGSHSGTFPINRTLPTGAYRTVITFNDGTRNSLLTVIR